MDPTVPAEPKDASVVLAVCQGRVCSSRGAAEVHLQLTNQGIPCEHGGCYGLCDWGVNVVARRDGHHQLVILADDEVYCGVTVADAAAVTTIAEVPSQWHRRRFDPEVHAHNNPIAERIARVRMRRQRA
jgi:hypothetical protein